MLARRWIFERDALVDPLESGFRQRAAIAGQVLLELIEFCENRIDVDFQTCRFISVVQLRFPMIFRNLANLGKICGDDFGDCRERVGFDKLESRIC